MHRFIRSTKRALALGEHLKNTQWNVSDSDHTEWVIIQKITSV
jgi:hypothetical protein